jgi:hypothetical protein
VCPELFELKADDGVRNWGAYLKPTLQRIGTAVTNRWIQDPIPVVVPRHTNVAAAASVGRNATVEGVLVPSFNDRMVAVQNQITAIKHDGLAAQ